jgi:hypothetical protein
LDDGPHGRILGIPFPETRLSKFPDWRTPHRDIGIPACSSGGFRRTGRNAYITSFSLTRDPVFDRAGDRAEKFFGAAHHSARGWKSTGQEVIH